jgi:hypothetical protein
VALWRRATLSTLIAICLTFLVLAGVADSIVAQGWASAAIGLAGNIAASGIVAAATVAGFVIGTRRRAYVRVLTLQRRQNRLSTPSGRHLAEWRGLARAAVAQLKDVKQPGYLFVEALDARARALFLRELVREFAEQSVVIIAVSGDMLANTTPQDVVVAEFSRLLAEAGATNASLTAILEWLIRRKRAVVVIDGMDANDRQLRPGISREIVSSRISYLRVAKLPFVAIGETGSTPAEFLGRLLVLPTVRSMAPDVPHEATGHTSSPFQYGPLMPFVRSLQVVGYLTDTADLDAPAAEVMHEMAAQLIRQESKNIEWDSLISAVSPSRVDRFLIGVAELEETGMIIHAAWQPQITLRFQEPELREFAAGIWVGRSTLPLGYSARRGVTAFTGEVLQRTLAGGARLDEIWLEACSLATAHGWLQPVGDVYRVLRDLPGPRVELSATWLARAWEAAGNREQIAFVQRLPDAVPGDITRFLWDQLVSRISLDTRHAVRRSVARRLGRNGSSTWCSLADDWRALAQIASSDGLAWYQRRDSTWREHGLGVSSLCWVFPSIVLTCDDTDRGAAEELLTGLADAVCPGGGLEHDGLADVGIEISLSEGCVDACTLSAVAGTSVCELVWNLVRSMTLFGRSWVSRLNALQAAALATASDPKYTDELGALCSALSSRTQHPLFRAYVNQLSEALRERGATFPTFVNSLVWADDTEVLQRAGGGLADPCVEIFGMTTLLLNLVEARIRSTGDWEAQQSARVAALTQSALPACLGRFYNAVSFGVAECRCPMRLCGPNLEPVSLREISPAFANRCLSSFIQTGETPKSRTDHAPWSARAFGLHMRRIARQ